MKAYILTDSDVKLFETQWEAAKQRIWTKHGEPMADTSVNDAVRVLNYTIYGWLADVVRK